MSEGKEPKSYKDDVYIHEVVVPSGKVYTLKPLLARDMMKATRLNVIDPSKDPAGYGENADFCHMAASTRINGSDGMPEDFANMPIEDYNIFSMLYNSVNFPSALRNLLSSPGLQGIQEQK